MIEQGAAIISSAIEATINQVEKHDPESKNRNIVYGSKQSPEKNEQVVAVTNLDRLQLVSGNLLDLWVYEGSKSLEYIKQSKAYQITDPYINYI